jgi:uncharacterized protein (DUF736 family)
LSSSAAHAKCLWKREYGTEIGAAWNKDRIAYGTEIGAAWNKDRIAYGTEIGAVWNKDRIAHGTEIGAAWNKDWIAYRTVWNRNGMSTKQYGTEMGCVQNSTEQRWDVWNRDGMSYGCIHHSKERCTEQYLLELDHNGGEQNTRSKDSTHLWGR